MLWLKIKPGRVVTIGSSTLTVLDRDTSGVLVKVDGHHVSIPHGEAYRFSLFTLHVSKKHGNTVLGFDAPSSIPIHRI